MSTKNNPDEGTESKRKRKKIVIKRPSRVTGLVDVDDVLRKVNHIQIERESVKFKVSLEDSPVVENILRDAELIVSRTTYDNHVSYSVDPGVPVIEGNNALENLDEYSDEIPEDGQLFD